MSSALAAENCAAYSLLRRARELKAPVASATEGGEGEGHEFWEEHGDLLRGAWSEWEDLNRKELPDLRPEWHRLIDEELLEAVEAAWADPSPWEREGRVRDHWTEVMPGVYQGRFFRPESVHLIRAYIDMASSRVRCGIPTRRPNGMNRHGLILDSKTDGGVAVRGLEEFVNGVLVDRFVRPLGRMFFPEYMGRDQEDDSESYAFTIRYKGGEDLSLREHSDASLITLNVNLNTRDEMNQVEGSSLYFVGDSKAKHNVTFQPGMAYLHRGLVRHGALPIESGERVNMVIWLFGKYGVVRVASYPPSERLPAQKRWEKSVLRN